MHLSCLASLALPGLLAASAGCAEQHQVAASSRSGHAIPATTAELAEMDRALVGVGRRCPGGIVCTCRPIDEFGRGVSGSSDAEDPPPAEDWKRFELRTGRGNDEMRITVEGLGTFRKSGDSPEPGCIYVDLPPGPTRVHYHVVARDAARGLEARLRVSEYSPAFRRWYRTFAYRCGNGSEPCTIDDARDAVETLGRVPGGKHDPCGSTRIRGLRFSTARPADAAVADFDLHFVLDVYKFAPRFAPETATCKGVTQNPGGDAE